MQAAPGYLCAKRFGIGFRLVCLQSCEGGLRGLATMVVGVDGIE